jgi:hypothetical protein
MEPGPPKKSRRIAKKKRSEQAQVDQSTNVSTTVSTSNNQYVQDMLVAANYTKCDISFRTKGCN